MTPGDRAQIQGVRNYYTFKQDENLSSGYEAHSVGGYLFPGVHVTRPDLYLGLSMAQWSCHCLNVRIEGLIPQSEPPSRSSPGFSWVFPGQEGIHVVSPSDPLRKLLPADLCATLNDQKHYHLTFRTRKRIVGESGAPLSQTLLTCLVCRRPVYRITSAAEANSQVQDKPVECILDSSEPLESSDGWVEISTEDCLVSKLGLYKYVLLSPEPALT